MKNDLLRKPDWLRIKLPSAEQYRGVKEHLDRHKLHTICESGNCPNQGECWAAKTATFMILGNICTRNCRFCGVDTGSPLPVDLEEPQHLALAVKDLEIRHCVLTSVTRDDLSDGGASIWAATIRAIRAQCPETTIEALVPDFMGDTATMQLLLDAAPDVIAHNMETVARLTSIIRIKAQYQQSIDVLKFYSDHNARVKSGIMVGLGETDDEVAGCISDVAKTGCSILTIGQYLQPSRHHHPVVRYV
jgi:lipoic acid synthetase